MHVAAFEAAGAPFTFEADYRFLGACATLALPRALATPIPRVPAASEPVNKHTMLVQPCACVRREKAMHQWHSGHTLRPLPFEKEAAWRVNGSDCAF